MSCQAPLRLTFSNVYMVVNDLSAIDAAVRLLPEGLASLFICIFLS